MAENKRTLFLCDRSELRVTGVKEVESFDENGALIMPSQSIAIFK